MAHSPYTPQEQRELEALHIVFRQDPDRQVACTHKMLSVAAKVPLGSVALELARAGVRPVFPNSSIFRCGDLAKFISERVADISIRVVERAEKRAGKNAVELAAAASAEVVKTNKLLLAQRDE